MNRLLLASLAAFALAALAPYLYVTRFRDPGMPPNLKPVGGPYSWLSHSHHHRGIGPADPEALALYKMRNPEWKPPSRLRFRDPGMPEKLKVERVTTKQSVFKIATPL